MKQNLNIPNYPPAFFIKLIEYFRHTIVRITRKLTIPNVAIMEMVQGFYVAKAIGIAAELNISDLLKNGDKSISKLALETQAHEDSLYRLMRMLASQGVYKEKKNRIFSQNRLSKTLLNNQESMRYMVMHQVNGRNWKLFDELEYVVKTGNNAAKKIFGADVFEYLEANPEKNEIYNQAMSNSSVMLSHTVVSEYKFKNAKCIVDVGGGQGVLLSILLSKNKNLKGIVFDLPHVVEGAKTNFEKYGVSDRTESISGNFFESVPKGGDHYIMKSIIHLLSDEECVILLEKIKKILPEKGKILIIEPIIENNNRYSFAKLFDIQMMIGLNGGKERTEQEYSAIVKNAGLKLKKVVKTAGPFSVIEVVL